MSPLVAVSNKSRGVYPRAVSMTEIEVLLATTIRGQLQQRPWLLTSKKIWYTLDHHHS